MFNVATARTRIGLASNDATKDTLLTAALDTAIAVSEQHCNRKFKQVDGVISLYHVMSNTLQLPRYPINTLTSITADGVVITERHVDYDAGLIMLDGFLVAHEIEVDVDAGYATYPADLELAFWMVFDAIWPAVSGSGAAAAGSGPIKAIRSNGASVEYDTSGGAVSGFASSTASGLPVGAVTILDKYRLVQC